MGLPFIDLTLDELNQRDLVPFSAVLKDNPGMIMMAHLADYNIDASGKPASLSSVFVQNILRSDLHYQGVIITDAMGMGAIVQNFGSAQADVLAVQAGCDMLAFSSASSALEAANAIHQAVLAGHISEQQINHSVRRILELKGRFQLSAQPTLEERDLSLSTGADIARTVSRQAIYAQNMQSVSILAATSVVILSPDRLPAGPVSGNNLSLLGELIQAHNLPVNEWIYPVNDPYAARQMINQAFENIPNQAIVLVVTWDAYLNAVQQNDTTQQFMIDRAVQAGNKAVVVAISSPFDLLFVPDQQPAVATFGALDVQIEALVDNLFSNGPYTGAMPVNLSR